MRNAIAPSIVILYITLTFGSPIHLQLSKDVTPDKVSADTIAQAAEAFRSEGCTLLEVNTEGTKIKRKQVRERVGGRLRG